jgi:uncharacterized protein (DUF2062 family)
MTSVVKTRKFRRSQPFWKRQMRYFYLRLLRMREHPQVIARGLACGVFAGCFPLFGLQTIIGIVLAFLMRGNKLAAAAGTWLSNPLTDVPLFIFNYKIGHWLLSQYSDEVTQTQFSFNWDSWSKLAESGTDFLIVLFLGCTVVGMITSLIAYIGCLRLLSRHYKR